MTRSPFSPFSMAIIAFGALLVIAASTFSTAATTPSPTPLQGVCRTCNGTGTSPFACTSCGGSGIRNGVACGTCGGRGRSVCASCRGTGRW